jgi:MFS family permease
MKHNKDLSLLYWFNFFKSLQFFGAIAVPFYLYRAGLDYTRMFLLETIFSVGMFAFEIPTGVVADRWGRKISLFFGSCFFGAGFLLFGIYTSYSILIIAEVICALGMTLLSGADRAILYEILKEGHEENRAATVMARYDAYGTAGMFLAFPAGSLFTGSHLVAYKAALGLVFVATAFAVGISSLIVLFVKEGKYERSGENAIKQGLAGFLYIFRHPRLRIFSFNFAFISSVTFFMFWFYQTLLLANKFPVTWQGFIASGFNLTAILLLLLTPVAKSCIGIRNTLFFSSLIPGILYIGVSVIPGLIMAMIAIFGVTNLKMFRAPILNALMNDQIESSSRATVLSGVSMIERIATALLYPVVGLLTDISFKMTFLTLGIITMILSILLRIGEDCGDEFLNPESNHSTLGH